MNFSDFVKKVLTKLNELGVEYAITGALAVSYYGRPRTTIDVDVIIRATPEQFEELADALSKIKIRCSAEELRNAWESKYRVATFRNNKGLQLDIILTQEKIPRREAKILGIKTYVQEAGPLLLEKLRLMKNTIDEEKRVIDKMDVLSILKNVEELDVETLKDRAKVEATLDLLEELLSEAEQE
ncbi:MAG: hypothetical protein QXX17_04740 [Conexivisphaerales archaeon]